MPQIHEYSITIIRLEERHLAMARTIDDLKAEVFLQRKELDEIHDVFTKWKFAAVTIVIISSIVGGVIAAMSQIATMFGWKH